MVLRNNEPCGRCGERGSSCLALWLVLRRDERNFYAPEAARRRDLPRVLGVTQAQCASSDVVSEAMSYKMSGRRQVSGVYKRPDSFV